MPNTQEITKLLDSIGWRILAELQENARIQYVELGRRVGLSTVSVIERIRRMEDAGIITGYSAQIDHHKVGLDVSAYIRVRIIGDYIPRFISAVRDMQEVSECHRITGEDTFLVKVYAATTEDLARIVDKLNPYMTTNTMLVFSSPVMRRAIEAPQNIAPASGAQKKKTVGNPRFSR